MTLSRFLAASALLAIGAALSACGGTQLNPVPNVSPDLTFRQVVTRGYVLQDGALQQVPVGSSRDQVQFVLGTPTTVSNFGSETFYYITQTVERLPAMTPRVIDQRVLAIGFDREGRVARINNYGLQDGRLFDFATRTTPTGGRQTTFVQQLFQNLSR